MSDPVILTCSVPQGSVIGPQKFVAYTKNIVETIEAFMVNNHLYADVIQLQNHMRLDSWGYPCQLSENGTVSFCDQGLVLV